MRILWRVNAEWIQGESEDGGRKGMFPVSFVDKVPADIPSKPDTTEPTQPAKVCHTCSAVYT